MKKENLWCCVNPTFRKGEIHYNWMTLSYQMKSSKQKLTENWNVAKKHGWRCIKIELTLTPII